MKMKTVCITTEYGLYRFILFCKITKTRTLWGECEQAACILAIEERTIRISRCECTVSEVTIV